MPSAEILVGEPADLGAESTDHVAPLRQIVPDERPREKHLHPLEFVIS